MLSRITFSNESLPISTAINDIKNEKRGGLDLQPTYQRGYIWMNDFRDRLIYSIVRNYPIGSISLRVLDTPNPKGAKKEVVDGQQRLKTIFDFVTGIHFVHGEVAEEIINYVIDYMGDEQDATLEKLKKRQESGRYGKLSFSELPKVIRGNFDSFNLSVVNITNVTEKEVSSYFTYVQNQERLRAGEIIKAIPDSLLKRYMPEKDIIDGFLRKMSFSNSRRHFDKIFYANLGLIDGKIGFGTMDRTVLDYVSNGGDLSITTQEKTGKINKQIKSIVDCAEIPDLYVNANTRLMKFLLILMAQGYVDFSIATKEKLSCLKDINDKLSAFSSAKADSVDVAYADYALSVREEHRLLALVARGGHTFKRVDNRMKILAYYINNSNSKTATSGIKAE